MILTGLKKESWIGLMIDVAMKAAIWKVVSEILSETYLCIASASASPPELSYCVSKKD